MPAGCAVIETAPTALSSLRLFSPPGLRRSAAPDRSSAAQQPERPRGSSFGAAVLPRPPPGCALLRPRSPRTPTGPPSTEPCARLVAPASRCLPWPLTGTDQAERVRNSTHAAAAVLRSIPATAAPGLAVPSSGGGRAWHTNHRLRLCPRSLLLVGPWLSLLLVARRLRHPVFYPRQSPPSRLCIKPFRPDRPGTSMRESRGAGPLPPGPPPALCRAESCGHSNTCAFKSLLPRTRAHLAVTRALAHSLAQTKRTHASGTHAQSPSNVDLLSPGLSEASAILAPAQKPTHSPRENLPTTPC